MTLTKIGESIWGKITSPTDVFPGLFRAFVLKNIQDNSFQKPEKQKKNERILYDKSRNFKFPSELILRHFNHEINTADIFATKLV